MALGDGSVRLASPDTDLFTNSLYRFASVTISVSIALFFVYAVHLLLNKFSETRLVVQ